MRLIFAARLRTNCLCNCFCDFTVFFFIPLVRNLVRRAASPISFQGFNILSANHSAPRPPTSFRAPIRMFFSPKASIIRFTPVVSTLNTVPNHALMILRPVLIVCLFLGSLRKSRTNHCKAEIANHLNGANNLSNQPIFGGSGFSSFAPLSKSFLLILLFSISSSVFLSLLN